MLVIALAACGRVGFDPIAGDHGAPGDGPPGDGDGKPGGGDGGSGSAASMTDGQESACATAIPVQSGVKKTTSTCLGGDRIDGCGPANTQEVVFAFAVPTTQAYTAEAFDTGTNNISNSTAVVDSTCTTTTGACAGLLGQMFNQGDTVYFVVEDDAGGCTTIDFLVAVEN